MRFNHEINPEYMERDAKANAELTAKYAKHAKKMQMQRSMKHNLKAETYSEHAEGMQRRMRSQLRSTQKNSSCSKEAG